MLYTCNVIITVRTVSTRLCPKQWYAASTTCRAVPSSASAPDLVSASNRSNAFRFALSRSSVYIMSVCCFASRPLRELRHQTPFTWNVTSTPGSIERRYRLVLCRTETNTSRASSERHKSNTLVDDHPGCCVHPVVVTGTGGPV
eukprot:9404251-Pyramimonas_sp.AAC.1